MIQDIKEGTRTQEQNKTLSQKIRMIRKGTKYNFPTQTKTLFMESKKKTSKMYWTTDQTPLQTRRRADLGLCFLSKDKLLPRIPYLDELVYRTEDQNKNILRPKNCKFIINRLLLRELPKKVLQEGRNCTK